MNRRTACLGVSTLSLTAGIVLAAGASSASSGIPVPLMVIANHMTLDHLGHNLLTTNRESLEALVSHPLDDRSLADDATLHNALRDPRARETMQAIVECALGKDQPPVSWTPTPEDIAAKRDQDRARRAHALGQGAAGLTVTRMADPDAIIDVEPRSFKGSLGLCRDWATQKPSEACQEVVSACLLARNNPAGERLDIWLQGAPSLGGSAQREMENFPWMEGAFYGNLFDAEALNEKAEVTLVGPYTIERPAVGEDEVIYTKAFVCAGEQSGDVPESEVPPDIYMQTRTCKQSAFLGMRENSAPNAGCVARFVGLCRSPRRTVTIVPTGTTISYPLFADASCTESDRAYNNCRGGDRVWSHALTVFLQGQGSIVPSSAAALARIKANSAPPKLPGASGAAAPRAPESQKPRAVPVPAPPPTRG
ncbi:hypothetical protein [Sorangium sp. So ce1335]|uniref:hypothetical protein n=1 Tax=Sorangium sp. So ce1335 TaxID=3133335 RepID=UPI003F6261C2